jgi:hypothetical protein
MNSLPNLITKNVITITINHNPYYVYRLNDKGELNPKYDTIKNLIREKNFDEILNVLIPKSKIIKLTNKYFVITESNQIFMKDAMDEELPDILAKRLIDFIDEQLPLEPLVNFWINLRKNPNKNSKDSLYRFLEHNKHSITEDGCFLAYKAVNFNKEDNYTKEYFNYKHNIGKTFTDTKLKLIDVHSKTFDNSIGTIVKMKREDVDSNSNVACSHGLHVASYEYAKNHFNGDVIVEVLVNPANVVAVPYDYNNQKMRVCEYKVINYVNPKNNEKLLKQDVDNLINIKYEY